MDGNTSITSNSILEALSLVSSHKESSKSEENFCCIFCDHAEKGNDNKPILKHLFAEHRLVIADVDEVADLRLYLLFWKTEYQGLHCLSFSLHIGIYDELITHCRISA